MSKNHSDFWREPYLQGQEFEGEVSEEKILNECLSDVSRIVNAYDNSINVVYKGPAKNSNILNDNTIVIDPKIALSPHLSLGKKVDVYAGEVILGAALRNRSQEVKNFCITHAKRACDVNLPDVDRAASLLYLAMETDATCSTVREKTPGFVKYIESRAKEYQNISSQRLQDSFNEGPDDSHKFMAILREFDTFGSCPLDYGSFNKNINSILNQVRNISEPKVRLGAAYQLAKKYLVNVENQPVDFEMAGDLFTSAQSFGISDDMLPSSELAEADLGELDNSNNSNEEEGTQSKNSEKFKHIKTNFITDDLSTKLVKNDNTALKIYEHDCQQVLPLSQVINESLQILNHQHKTWDKYSLRQGELDEGSLHKLSDNSDNVFYQNETMPKTYIQLGFLIDESASMNQNSGGGLTRGQIARRLITAFVEGTKDILGLDLQIYGHAAPEKTCNVYKYFDSTVDSEATYKVGYSNPRLYNYDGFAIQRTAQDMLEHEKDYKRRIMIILSDGEPSASSYSGNEAKAHISESVREVNSQGIETYVIGIDNAFPDQDALYLYGNGKYIILPDCDLNNMSMIISAFLQEIANS